MKNNKLPYNSYKDSKGYIIPKSIIIKNNPDIIEWLSSEPQFNNLFKDKPNNLILNKEWICIGIGHSWMGYLYAFTLSVDQEYINKYCQNDFHINFNENYDKFKKYMTWISKLGPWFTKQNFK